MKTFYKPFFIILISMFMLSCGDSNPKITHIVVTNDRLGTLIDSNDSKTLDAINDIFYDKKEAPNAGPEFFYFVDITIDKVTSRWQYSSEGYIRNYEEGHTMIYQLRDIASFNKAVNIQED